MKEQPIFSCLILTSMVAIYISWLIHVLISQYLDQLLLFSPSSSSSPYNPSEKKKGSVGGGDVPLKMKAKWEVPKVIGASPSERWGHSACYFNGSLYIFGGCRGGVHFSEVLVFDVSRMSWNVLKTSGPNPGPRDSHSAVLVGHRMLIFGGTNGSKKMNDLHILDLISGEWTRPRCRGNPPPPRESHTANVIGDGRMIIFGGSGAGEANYLNDLHVLDVQNMEWSSPETRGVSPAPRDSHTSAAVGNRLFMFGGDSGDRYQQDVFVFDVNNLTWSQMNVVGGLAEARAGHASVGIGSKMYVVGGVGDKTYYNDVWVLDLITCSWLRVETTGWGRRCKGRFSHTANVTSIGIAVFGGCGEDERPLNELILLRGVHEQPERLMVSINQQEEEEEGRKRRRRSSEEMKSTMVGAEVRGRVDEELESGAYLITAHVNGKLYRGVLLGGMPLQKTTTPTQSCHFFSFFT